MIRDVLVACGLLAVLAVGLSFTEFGRSLIASIQTDAEENALTALEGRTWCYWPTPDGRCSWAMRAETEPVGGFTVAAYAAERDAGGELRIGVARSGLIAAKDGFCQDRAQPVTQARLGYYVDEIGEVLPRARLRPATRAEHAAYVARLEDTGDAEVCFLIEGGSDGRWLQFATINGERVGPPDEFVLIPSEEAALLAAP